MRIQFLKKKKKLSNFYEPNKINISFRIVYPKLFLKLFFQTIAMAVVFEIVKLLLPIRQIFWKKKNNNKKQTLLYKKKCGIFFSISFLEFLPN